MSTSDGQTSVWVRDPVEAWISAKIISSSDDDTHTTYKLRRDDDDEMMDHKAIIGTTLAQNEDMKLRNVFDDGTMNLTQVMDLTRLTHLHEPAILESLCARFRSDLIYTYTGPILLAVNPFKTLHMYSTQTIEMYYTNGLLKGQGIDTEELPPHVYAVGDNAYRNLTDSGDAASGRNKRNQSILVSGESGAGKTESTKFIMKYLATIAGGDGKIGMAGAAAESVGGVAGAGPTGGHAIAARVLQSNPILEAFGNARTIRNDNSSRFGKFIEMQFDVGGVLVGARIATYLLEKVRLAYQAEDERNFHIFYQIYGASAEELKRWRVPAKEDCVYINQSGCYERKDGVADAGQHARMVKAMDIMGITVEEGESIFALVSAIMNLSGLEFVAAGEEGCEIVKEGRSGTSLTNLAALLSVSEEAVQTGLCTRRIQVGLEWFTKGLSDEGAADAKDALAKDIYSKMFNWVVKRVNQSIEHQSKIRSFIGVLDIFGFEVFEKNSFEQLCINYANEQLQQHFNQFVFKLEQKEYEKENIKWSFIDFPDNQACLDLIESKPLGLLALLDEQCLFPKGNDQSLASKLYEHLGDNARFSASRKHKVLHQFVINHYAGDVCYSTEGFCNKNKDQLHGELISLLHASSHPLIKTLYPAETAQSAAAAKKSAPGKAQGRSSIRLVTVGTQFKNQLASLLATIRETSPHYIRCLKPNDNNVPVELVRPRLVDQLRYGGVLEAVKVARAGYPTRLPLAAFVERYFMLAPGIDTHGKGKDPKVVCGKVVKALELEHEEHYQLGRTKVFLRKDAYEIIEGKRSAKLKDASVCIQALVRGGKHRVHYVKLLKGARVAQRIVRGRQGRTAVERTRAKRAAIQVQTCVRRWLAIRHFRKAMRDIVLMQNTVRAHFAKKISDALKYDKAILRIQSKVRAYKARKFLIMTRKAAVGVQCGWRKKQAKAQLKVLRVEAKQVGNLAKRVDDFKSRVQSLEVELSTERQRRRGAEASVKDLQAQLQHTQDELIKQQEQQVDGGSSDDAVSRAPAHESGGGAAAVAAPSSDAVVASSSNLLAKLVEAEERLSASVKENVALRQRLGADECNSDVINQEEERKSDASTSPAPGTSSASRLEKSSEELQEEKAQVEQLNAKLAVMKIQMEEQMREMDRVKEANEALRLANAAEDSQNDGTSLANKSDPTAVKTETVKVSLQVFEDIQAQRDEFKLQIQELIDQLAVAELTKAELDQAGVSSAKASPVGMSAQAKAEIEEKDRVISTYEEALTSTSIKMCESENRAMELHNDLVKLRRENENLSDKVSSMDVMSEQASGVKIILGRRLEQLILENRILRKVREELEEKLDYYTETNKLLSADVKETRRQLHDVKASHITSP